MWLAAPSSSIHMEFWRPYGPPTRLEGQLIGGHERRLLQPGKPITDMKQSPAEEQKPVKDVTLAAVSDYHWHVDTLRHGGSSRRERPWRSARSVTSVGVSTTPTSGGTSAAAATTPSSTPATPACSSTRRASAGIYSSSHRGSTRSSLASSSRSSTSFAAPAFPGGLLASPAAISRAVVPSEYPMVLGVALVQQGESLKALVKPWERDEWWIALTLRSRSSSSSSMGLRQRLTRREFRTGVRTILGVKEFGHTQTHAALSALAHLAHAATEAHIDACFDDLLAGRDPFSLLPEGEGGGSGGKSGSGGTSGSGGDAASHGQVAAVDTAAGDETVPVQRIAPMMRRLRRCAVRAAEEAMRRLQDGGGDTPSTDGDGDGDEAGGSALERAFSSLMRRFLEDEASGRQAPPKRVNKAKLEAQAKAEAARRAREEAEGRAREEEERHQAYLEAQKAKEAENRKQLLGVARERLLQGRRMMSTAVPPARFGSAASAKAFFRTPRVAAARSGTASARSSSGRSGRGGSAGPPPSVWLPNDAAIALTRYVAAKQAARAVGGGGTPLASSSSSSDSSRRSSSASRRCSSPGSAARVSVHLQTVQESLGALEC